MCENEDRGLSDKRPVPESLFEWIAVVEDRERRQVDLSEMMPYLKHFEGIFSSAKSVRNAASPLPRNAADSRFAGWKQPARSAQAIERFAPSRVQASGLGSSSDGVPT